MIRLIHYGKGDLMVYVLQLKYAEKISLYENFMHFQELLVSVRSADAIWSFGERLSFGGRVHIICSE